MNELTVPEQKVYDLLSKGYTMQECGARLYESKYEITKHVNSLIEKGYLKRDGSRHIVVVKKKRGPKQKPMSIQSSWSQQPPLKYHYEKVNGDVVPYNYKELPPDDPRRIEIERTLAKVKPHAKPIETVGIAAARKRREGA